MSTRRMILLAGLLLALTACASSTEEEIPTLMALPTVTETPVPTATVPAVTPFPAQVQPTATRATRTPAPTVPPTPASIIFTSVTVSQASVTANTNENCTSLTTRVLASISSESPLQSVTLKWNYEGRISSAPGSPMQALSGTDYTLTLGPFDRPGTVIYWVTAEDQAGHIVRSDEYRLAVEECMAPTTVPTRSTGPILTDTPYYGEAQSVHAISQEITVPLNTPVQITLSWSGGFPPIVIDQVSRPAFGLLSGGGVGYVYTPNPGFTGTDRFTFRARDSMGQASRGTITLIVGQ